MTQSTPQKQRILSKLLVAKADGKTYLGLFMGESSSLPGGICLNDAFPFSIAISVDEDGKQEGFPKAGTLDLCRLEPVASLHVRPTACYFIKSQNEATQEVYYETYVTFLRALREAVEKGNNLIHPGSQDDLNRLNQISADPTSLISKFGPFGKKHGR